MKKKVAVIGGGASGMMAAIEASGQGAEVTIYEHMRLGKKYWQPVTASAIWETCT